MTTRTNQFWVQKGTLWCKPPTQPRMHIFHCVSCRKLWLRVKFPTCSQGAKWSPEVHELGKTTSHYMPIKRCMGPKIGMPPVILHFYGIFPELNHPFFHWGHYGKLHTWSNSRLRSTRATTPCRIISCKTILSPSEIQSESSPGPGMMHRNTRRFNDQNIIYR